MKVIFEEGIHDLSDWKKRWSWSAGRIEDEYGGTVSISDMLLRITDRSFSWSGENVEEPPAKILLVNNASPGPHGLMRHRINDGLCIGHGAGTWDLLIGDFS